MYLVLELFLEDAPICPADNLINLKIMEILKITVGHGNEYLVEDGSSETTQRVEVCPQFARR